MGTDGKRKSDHEEVEGGGAFGASPRLPALGGASGKASSARSSGSSRLSRGGRRSSWGSDRIGHARGGTDGGSVSVGSGMSGSKSQLARLKELRERRLTRDGNQARKEYAFKVGSVSRLELFLFRRFPEEQTCLAMSFLSCPLVAFLNLRPSAAPACCPCVLPLCSAGGPRSSAGSARW